ncbi:MAG: 50S ribosomal protein L29 [Chloroflexaceae bacterium]|nr:50S ribosomal protein L29 [Chloroflexaceae bacterium]
MKAQELRSFDQEKLDSLLQDCYKELFNLRFQKETGRLTNVSRPRQVRRDIARIKTILRERELAEEVTGELPSG